MKIISSELKWSFIFKITRKKTNRTVYIFRFYVHTWIAEFYLYIIIINPRCCIHICKEEAPGSFIGRTLNVGTCWWTSCRFSFTCVYSLWMESRDVGGCVVRETSYLLLHLLLSGSRDYFLPFFFAYDSFTDITAVLELESPNLLT